MEYPMAATTLLYKRKTDGTVCVSDHLTDFSFEMCAEQAQFLRRLDGKTDPYSVETTLTRQEIDAFLEALDEIGFIRRSYILAKSFGTILLTVWIPKRTKLLKIIARINDDVLRVLWLPVLIAGCWLFGTKFDGYHTGGEWWGWLFGLTVGLVLHELAHGFAAVHYGAHFFEAGIFVRWLMPGAYVLVDEERIRNRLHRVHLMAAGVEMNFLLCGVGFLFAVFYRAFGQFWEFFSLTNLILGASNFLLAWELDGFKVMKMLLGAQEIPLVPKMVRAKGQDRIQSLFCFLTQLFLLPIRIALPALILLNIVMVFL